MRRYAIVTVFVAVLLAVAGCQGGSGSSTPAPKSTPELQQVLASGKKTVVFFLNPEGGPCRQQNEILKKLYEDRSGNFNVAFVSAMKQEDEKAFYDYGIRSLPSLVLVDSKGMISNHFPPGIQSYETVAQALDTAK